MLIEDRAVQLAVAATARAAALCRQVQQVLVIETLAKDDRSPVTVADFGAQAIVLRMIAEAFPDDPVIAEEDSLGLAQPGHRPMLEQVANHADACWPGSAGFGGPAAVLHYLDHGSVDQGGARFWTLDPIDGTKGFLRKDQYAVALALLIEGKVAVAALACPNLEVEPGSPRLGAVFFAARGQGAYTIPLDDAESLDKAHRIHVDSARPPQSARYCESLESAHSAHDEAAKIAARIGILFPPKRLDSQAKYAVVARGEADLYLRLSTRGGYVEKIWDHAAGALIVEEAGGRVTDIHGKDLEFHHGRQLSANQGVVVSNHSLHPIVLETLASLSRNRSTPNPSHQPA